MPIRPISKLKKLNTLRILKHTSRENVLRGSTKISIREADRQSTTTKDESQLWESFEVYDFPDEDEDIIALKETGWRQFSLPAPEEQEDFSHLFAESEDGSIGPRGTMTPEWDMHAIMGGNDLRERTPLYTDRKSDSQRPIAILKGAEPANDRERQPVFDDMKRLNAWTDEEDMCGVALTPEPELESDWGSMTAVGERAAVAWSDDIVLDSIETTENDGFGAGEIVLESIESDDVPEEDSDSHSQYEWFDVDRVIGEASGPGVHEYLLRWVGYAEETWVPASHCRCPDAIEAFRGVPRVHDLEMTLKVQEEAEWQPMGNVHAGLEQEGIVRQDFGCRSQQEDDEVLWIRTENISGIERRTERAERDGQRAKQLEETRQRDILDTEYAAAERIEMVRRSEDHKKQPKILDVGRQKKQNAENSEKEKDLGCLQREEAQKSPFESENSTPIIAHEVPSVKLQSIEQKKRRAAPHQQARILQGFLQKTTEEGEQQMERFRLRTTYSSRSMSSIRRRKNHDFLQAALEEERRAKNAVEPSRVRNEFLRDMGVKRAGILIQEARRNVKESRRRSEMRI